MTEVARGERKYGGTAYTFSELMAMDAAERNTILAQSIYDIDIKMEPLKDARANAVRLLEEYVRAQGPKATEVPAGDLLIKVERDVKWEYDVEEGLAQLTSFGVSQDEYDDAIQTTYKVNKAKLNKLLKRGGHIADIINQNCRSTVTGLKLKIQQAPYRERRPSPSFVSEFVPAGRPDEPLDLD